jgi:hypothetical protein
MTDTNFNGETFSEFVDFYSACVPYSVTTYGKVKKYEIILNPDNQGWENVLHLRTFKTPIF